MAVRDRVVAVYTRDGAAAFVGTIGECARFAGVSEACVMSAITPERQRRYGHCAQRGEYRFYPVEDDEEEDECAPRRTTPPRPKEDVDMLKKTMDAIMAEFDRLDAVGDDDAAIDAEVKRAKAVGSLAAQAVSVSRQVTDIVRLRAEMGDESAGKQIKGLLDA